MSLIIEEEREENGRNLHKNGFMHSMKKRKSKKQPLANISAEEVKSESSIRNETRQEIEKRVANKGKVMIIFIIENNNQRIRHCKSL